MERYLSKDSCNHWVNLDWDFEEATTLNLSIDPNEKVLHEEDYLLCRNTKAEITCRLGRYFTGIEIDSILTEKKTPIEWIGIFSKFKPEIDKILGVSLLDENLLSAIEEIETNKREQEIIKSTLIQIEAIKKEQEAYKESIKNNKDQYNPELKHDNDKDIIQDNQDKYISEALKTLNQAAAKFWKNADPEDKGTHPKNKEVIPWLIDNGFSGQGAKQGATLIRPKWAAKGNYNR